MSLILFSRTLHTILSVFTRFVQEYRIARHLLISLRCVLFRHANKMVYQFQRRARQQLITFYYRGVDAAVIFLLLPSTKYSFMSKEKKKNTIS